MITVTCQYILLLKHSFEMQNSKLFANRGRYQYFSLPCLEMKIMYMYSSSNCIHLLKYLDIQMIFSKCNSSFCMIQFVGKITCIHSHIPAFLQLLIKLENQLTTQCKLYQVEHNQRNELHMGISITWQMGPNSLANTCIIFLYDLTLLIVGSFCILSQL